MTCVECRKHVLDLIGQDCSAVVNDHLSICMECRHFYEIQLELHARFLPASAENLSPAFRQALGRRIAQERVFSWPDFLPDIAHLAGCIAATLVSIAVLPWPAPSVLIAGILFTGVSYFLQAKLRDALQGESL